MSMSDIAVEFSPPKNEVCGGNKLKGFCLFMFLYTLFYNFAAPSC